MPATGWTATSIRTSKPVNSARAQIGILEPEGDQFLEGRFWQGLVGGEVQRALCRRVALKLIGNLDEDRAAEGQVAEVIPKGRKPGDDLSVQPKRGDAVRDRLFGFRDDFENRAAERLERGSLRLFMIA